MSKKKQENGWLVVCTMTNSISKEKIDYYEVFTEHSGTLSPKEQAMKRFAEMMEDSSVYSASVCEIHESTEAHYTNIEK